MCTNRGVCENNGDRAAVRHQLCGVITNGRRFTWRSGGKDVPLLLKLISLLLVVSLRLSMLPWWEGLNAGKRRKWGTQGFHLTDLRCSPCLCHVWLYILSLCFPAFMWLFAPAWSYTLVSNPSLPFCFCLPSPGSRCLCSLAWFCRQCNLFVASVTVRLHLSKRRQAGQEKCLSESTGTWL